MSQISKCPNVKVILTYWEASVEVSELSYKSLLYSISVGSYCRIRIQMVDLKKYLMMEITNIPLNRPQSKFSLAKL